MTTPPNRLLDSNFQTEKIIRERLVAIYKRQFDEFSAELRKRLRATVLKPDGTFVEGPAAGRTKALAKSLTKLKAELATLAPLVAAQCRPLEAMVSKNTAGWLAREAKRAPKWTREGGINLAAEFKEILKTDLLVEKQVLDGSMKALASRKQQSLKRSLQALAKGNDVEAKVFQGLIGKHGAHDELLRRTRHFLDAGLRSGKNFNELATILERQIWGVDFTKTGTHKGVLAAAKRLIRTEYQHAHNLKRYEAGRLNPLVKKFNIQRDPGCCDECASTYSGGPWEYGAANEPPMPPLHPNCVTGGTLVAASGIERAMMRWYEGPICHLKTRAGRELSVTPNHPIVTSRGPVPAGELTSAMEIVAMPGFPNFREMEIAGKISTLYDHFAGKTYNLPALPDTFHGDGRGSQFCDVKSEGGLISAVPPPVSIPDLLERNDIEFDSLDEIQEVEFKGYVFNLQTPPGWYVAEGIVNLNCHCSVAGFVYERPKYRGEIPEMIRPKGKK